MTKEVMTTNPNLPAVFQGSPESYDEFSAGVTSGFPVISYRGRTWRVKKGGEEQVHLNEEGEAVQSIEVVLLKSNPVLAKIYYAGDYAEGDNSAPTCWSSDGVRPDGTATNKQHATCADCPMNVWGSKITPSGAKTKQCSDVRRMAVAFRHDIEQAATDPKHEVTPLLLRVPPASLNPLKDFVDKVLKPKGVPPFAVFTKIGFDTQVAFPKLTFKGSQFLNDPQGRVVMDARDSEDVRRVLAEMSVDASGGNTGSGATGQAPASAGEAAPAPAPSEPTKMQPAEEEELHSGEEEEEEDGGLAPPAPVTEEPDKIAEPDPVVPVPAKEAKEKTKKKKKAKKAATPAEPPATEPTEAVATGGDGEPSFDDMLDKLLGE